MDENTWLTGTDPVVLLNDLYPMRGLHSTQPQARKCRMYFLACARRAWSVLPPVCRTLVELAERFVDTPLGGDDVWKESRAIAERLMNSDGDPADLAIATLALTELDVVASEEPTPKPAAQPLPPELWRGVASLVYLPFEDTTPSFGWVPQSLHSLRLLREVYGNPCRLTPFSPEWRTDTACLLARQMYEVRNFSAMPILADALQDAGCEDDEVLNHCRNPQEHVRGCWVVDLVLDRR
jgi:hypothetical protein